MAYTERYVSVAGAGAHNGTSEANAWTLAEALTNVVAGERANVISGAYSSGADAVTNVGTVVSFICFRGYTGSIGDLDTQGRNADGTLNTTNFPVITLTGGLTVTNFNIWQNLYVTGAVAGVLIGITTMDRNTIMSCKFENTLSNASTRVVSADNNVQLINSDFSCTATTHGIVIDADNGLVIVGCRIFGNSNSTANLVLANNIVIQGCVIYGGSATIGIYMTNDPAAQVIIGNTIYGIGTAIQTDNGVIGDCTIINNHVTDCSKYIDSLYSGTANNSVIEAYNRTRDNTTPRTGIGEGLLVGEVTTDTGGAETDYTNAGAGNFKLIAAAPGVDSGMGI